MKPITKLTTKLFPKINLSSLHFRLLVGVAVLSAISLSSIGLWTTWKMQQLLINSHKQNIQELANTVPTSINAYDDMLSEKDAIDKAINQSSINKFSNTYLWLKNNNQTITESANVQNLSPSIKKQLVSLTNIPVEPYLYEAQKNYFILCSSEIKLKDNSQVKIIIAHDITNDQRMFTSMVESVIVGCCLVFIFVLITTATYIKYSLEPLRQINKMAEDIKLEDISESRLYLKNAPQEVEELANTLNMMLSRLSFSWQKEREFVSNVSHELRTPLTIVQGYLQSLLRRQDNLTEIQKEALHSATSEAERTVKMLQDLLNLARADNGHLHLNIQPVILNDLVIEVKEMTQQYSGREIKIIADNEQFIVKADSNYLRNVFLNLIDNAINYSDLSTPILLRIQKQKQSVIIQVCDQGEGIALQHQSRIFERFYRIDEARNRSHNHVGLGLSIAKTLIEAMGGNISVRSKLGEGSTFIITLSLW